MRLLNTKEFYFEEFFDKQIPKYVILSHRWEKEEVSFQDWEAGRKKLGDGYLKIMRFCALAQAGTWQTKVDLEAWPLYKGVQRLVRYTWAWVDTCCIDKKSSAELSEVINSMFKWYQKAECCIVYLSDVDDQRNFEESAWFTRGWTLQELLAPMTVQFFNRHWKYIGNRDSLISQVSAASGIPEQYLRSDDSYSRIHMIHNASIAVKMSWAARRTTTREEDMAYCLMGIFDVNIPLLYGEGLKAFRRLQLEIMKESNDESIFAWEGGNSGVLAISPFGFLNSGNVQLAHEALAEGSSSEMTYLIPERPPYTMTNKGLEFTAYLIPYGKNNQLNFSIPLNCTKSEEGNSLGILVTRDGTGDCYWRLTLVDINIRKNHPEGKVEKIYLKA